MGSQNLDRSQRRQIPRRGPSLETRPSLETSRRHGKDPERGPGPEISRSRGSGLRAVRLREHSPSRRVVTAAAVAPKNGGKRTRRRMMPQPQKPKAKMMWRLKRRLKKLSKSQKRREKGKRKRRTGKERREDNEI